MVDDSVVEAVTRQLLDVKGMVEDLVADMTSLATTINPSRPDTYRSYVRSVFAFVEGSLSGVCGFVLEAGPLVGWTLEDEERRVFWDVAPLPNTPRPDGPRARFLDRVKVVFKACSRLFGEGFQPEFGGSGFGQFRRASKLRDRLMHPKRRQDLAVTLDDLKAADEARDWFRMTTKSLLESAVKNVVGQRGRRTSG